MPKLPRYVFRRANGSYRYKRNVPKALRPYILKQTLYRQLGASYAEAMANLPRVHHEVEQIFQSERMRHPGERAEQLIRANLGDSWVTAAQSGQIGQSPDTLPMDAYMDLADELEDTRLPRDVVERVRYGDLSAPAMTLERVFYLYLRDKQAGGVTGEKLQSLEHRVERLRQDVGASLGQSYWRYKPLEGIRRREANTLRDFLLQRLAPSSVQRVLNILKAAINHVIVEEELDSRNPFAALKIEGAGASKHDRLPLSEADMVQLSPAYESNPEALALFVTLADTGARLAEIVGLERQDVDPVTESLHIRPNQHRGLKTKNSTRQIPLSPRALALLLSRVEGETAPEAPLFPRYAVPRGSDKASAMLMKRLRTQISDRKKTTHSLRHRMKDRLRNSDCPEPLSLAILGHSQNSIADNYGAGYALEKMRDAMQKVWTDA